MSSRFHQESGGQSDQWRTLTPRVSIDAERYRTAVNGVEEVLKQVAIQTAEVGGTRAAVFNCDTAGYRTHNLVEPNAFACMIILHRPLQGDASSNVAATQYLIRRDAFAKEDVPLRYHSMQLVLEDAEGRPLLGTTLGPCSAKSPIRGFTNCRDRGSYSYLTTGIQDVGVSYAFVGAIPMYEESKGIMRYGAFDFEFEVEADADVLKSVTTARATLQYESGRR